MSGFDVPSELEAEIDELISHYPERRSASLMILHEVQEHFGWISEQAIEWIAGKLDLKPINIFELVTFYPMFRQEPAGKYQFKVCRTLSCALAGSGKLHQHLCEKFGVDAHKHGLQTTEDGRFSIEFVECIASCGTAPVMAVNEDFHENVSIESADKIVEDCR